MNILKRHTDLLRLRVTSTDDLWTISHLCRPRRRIGMMGERRDQTTAGLEGGRAKAAARKRMWIVLEIHSVEYQTFSDTLRAHGVIHEAGFDKGSHHTHVISVGDEIELTVEGGFPAEDRQLIAEAKRHSSKSTVAIAVTEADEVLLFEVTMHGLREVAAFTMRGGGKYEGSTESSTTVRSGFMKKVARDIDLQLNSGIPLVICGPGMARDRLAEMLRAEGSERPLRSVATSIGGRAAANEVLVDGLAAELLSDHALTKQINLLEEAFSRMVKAGDVAYGEDALVKAMDQGAIETLLVLADKLRDDESRIDGSSWSEWCSRVSGLGGELVQCTADHDAGLQLEGMGGAIALLRYVL